MIVAISLFHLIFIVLFRSLFRQLGPRISPQLPLRFVRVGNMVSFLLPLRGEELGVTRRPGQNWRFFQVIFVAE